MKEEPKTIEVNCGVAFSIPWMRWGGEKWILGGTNIENGKKTEHINGYLYFG